MIITDHEPYLRKFAKLFTVFILAVLAYALYSEWNAFVLTTVEWQKELHSMLASHIKSVSEDVYKYGGALIALSFGYGVFHAVGPGHGKAVIVTYLGTNRESIRKGIIISFAAATLQSIVAILLVSGLTSLLKFRLAEAHNYGNDMALASYILVMILGLMLVVGAIRRLLNSRKASPDHNEIKTKETDQGDTHSHEFHKAHDHEHHHGTDCGCSHTHVPEKNETLWQTMTVILSMGIRPCSGAIVVLIYAHLVDVYHYGVAATLLMGLGTGLSISLIAVATLYARSWLERFVNVSAEVGAQTHFAYSHYLRLLGGIILLALGWSFYSAASALSAGHPLF